MEGARFEPAVPPQKSGFSGGMGTVTEATRRSLQTVTTVSTLVEAGIDKNLASQKPPFRVMPASGLAGTGEQIDPETVGTIGVTGIGAAAFRIGSKRRCWVTDSAREHRVVGDAERRAATSPASTLVVIPISLRCG